MHLPRWISKYLIIAAIAVSPMSSFAGIFVSVGIAPPPLPVYEQPVCPDDGYLWTPGYWAYGDYGYYWVPGVWVPPPAFGLLWTPGYWGYGDSGYFFHNGYWGSHVGFYGGINYGFGYGGRGYGGGRWEGNHFFYNSAANNVRGGNFHNTYVDRNTINNFNNSRNVSYNGGSGGVAAQPTAQERQFSPRAPRSTHLHPASAYQNGRHGSWTAGLRQRRPPHDTRLRPAYRVQKPGPATCRHTALDPAGSGQTQLHRAGSGT